MKKLLIVTFSILTLFPPIVALADDSKKEEISMIEQVYEYVKGVVTYRSQ